MLNQCNCRPRHNPQLFSSSLDKNGMNNGRARQSQKTLFSGAVDAILVLNRKNSWLSWLGSRQDSAALHDNITNLQFLEIFAKKIYQSLFSNLFRT